MATVNLGRIKPVFRGAYSGSTAYVVDDIVTHGNESFICIQAHGAGTQATSQGSYWTKLAAKGTDGTDVGTTITTQGDILYRDGSGLQRLAKPASNKFLQNTSGGVLSWETVSSKVLGVTQYTNSTRQSLSSADTGVLGFDTTYTQIKAGSKLRFDISIIGFYPDAGAVNLELVFNGTTYQGFGSYAYHAQPYPDFVAYSGIIDGDSSTGSKAWKYQWNHRNSTGKPFQVLNPTHADDNRLEQSTSRVIITELDI